MLLRPLSAVLRCTSRRSVTHAAVCLLAGVVPAAAQGTPQDGAPRVAAGAHVHITQPGAGHRVGALATLTVHTAAIARADVELLRRVTQQASCEVARSRARELVAMLNGRMTVALRAEADTVTRKTLARGASRAAGYNAFYAGESLRGLAYAAAWGALTAASQEWNVTYVANAGISLIYLGYLDDAETFLSCAATMNPASPLIVEAQAMRAYWQKDCAQALRLIAQVTQLMPSDMNAHYSTGVIRHRCGDRAGARLALSRALQIKPDDQTVRAAIMIVDPGSQPSPNSTSDVRPRLLAECAGRLNTTITRATAFSAEEYVRTEGREQVEDDVIELRELIAKYHADLALLRAAPLQPGEGRDERLNTEVTRCAVVIIRATEWMLNGVIHSFEGRLGIPARALGITSAMLSRKMILSGNVFEQDARVPLDRALESAERALQSCTTSSCVRSAARAYCGTVHPLGLAFNAAVGANIQTAQRRFPRAVEDYVSSWIPLANEAVDFANQALASMKPDRNPRDAVNNVRRWHDAGRQLIDTLMRRDISAAEQVLSSDANNVGWYAGYEECSGGQGSSLNLAAVNGDSLIAALIAATELDAQPKLSCNIEVGGMSLEWEVTRSGDVSVSAGSGYVSASGTLGASPGGDRVGVSVSADRAMNAPAGGVAVRAGMQVWGEAGRGGVRNFGGQASAEAGLGIGVDGARTACYGGEATVTFSGRAFAEKLSR